LVLFQLCLDAFKHLIDIPWITFDHDWGMIES